MTPMQYYIYSATRGKWLQDDEKSWGSFFSAVEFFNYRTACGIAERESIEDNDVIVFGYTP